MQAGSATSLYFSCLPDSVQQQQQRSNGRPNIQSKSQLSILQLADIVRKKKILSHNGRMSKQETGVGQLVKGGCKVVNKRKIHQLAFLQLLQNGIFSYMQKKPTMIKFDC